MAVNQSFNTNVYDASRNQRSYGGNVVGAWRTVSLNGTFDRNEYFYNHDTIGRQSATRRACRWHGTNGRCLRNAPIYVSANTEVAHLDRQHRARRHASTTAASAASTSRLRCATRSRSGSGSPSTRRSAGATRSTRAASDRRPDRRQDRRRRDLNRQYFTLQAQARRSGVHAYLQHAGQRLRRAVQAHGRAVSQRPADVGDRRLRPDHRQSTAYDSIVGEHDQLQLRHQQPVLRQAAYRRGPAELQHRKSSASSWCRPTTRSPSPLSTTRGTRPASAPRQASNFSPISLSVRATPTTQLNATAAGRSSTAATANCGRYRPTPRYNWTGRVQTTVGWTKRFFIDESDWLQRSELARSLSEHRDQRCTRSTIATAVNYSFNYDILRIRACCSNASRRSTTHSAAVIAMRVPDLQLRWAVQRTIPSDHRFFLSFTLAGLGNFSPFNGALSGVPR